jgi:hypothetical protein
MLNFIDVDKNSKIYGCCYYPYWKGGNDPLVPQSNYVNARWQEMTLTLSLLYSKKYPNNNYHRDKKILELIKITMLYWTRIQNRDGSFSEWSIYEHGQPPTSFGLFAMIEAYKLIKNEFDENERKKIEKSFRRAANWLCENSDKTALNHETVAIAALYHTYEMFKEEKYLEKITEKINLIKSFLSPDGWIKEIDGPDSGYNSLSLTYLSLYWKSSKDKRVLPIIEKILNFNKYFVYPDGISGGGFNSRFATALWPLGFAIVSNRYEIAKILCYLSLKSVLEGKISGQYNYTDYQRCVSLYYILMTYDEIKNINIKKMNLKLIPSLSNKYFIKKMVDGKIIIIKNENYYLVLGHGCCIGELYSYKTGRTLIYTSPMNLVEISGIKLEFKNYGIFSSMSNASKTKIVFLEKNIQYKGTLNSINLGRWKLEKYNKRFIFYKHVLHFFSEYKLQFLNKIIFHIYKFLFRKATKNFIKFERNITPKGGDISVKNRFFIQNSKKNPEKIEIRETFFVPMWDLNSDFLFIINKGKYSLEHLLASHVFLTKNTKIYFKNKKILNINFEKPTKISFLIEDKNEMIKNMKFTGGRGLIIRMIPEQNGIGEFHLNYKISL